MPEEDNPMGLWLGEALSARLESQTRRSLRHFLEASRHAAIPLVEPRDTGNTALDEVAPHRDRQGETMQCIGTIDFSNLGRTDVTALNALPTGGQLTIFCSRQILSAPPKERRNFKLVFEKGLDKSKAENEEDEVILPLTIDEGSTALLTKMDELGINSLFRDEICAAANLYNCAQAGQNYLLGAALGGMEEDRQVCAFASGGISHSAARARDEHYSHLVEEARHWKLLARFRALKAGANIREARVYMRRQDLAERLFERAWLLCK